MSKTAKIFITIFAIIGIVALGYYFYTKNSSTSTGGTLNSIAKTFNPFGTSSNVDTTNTQTTTGTQTNTPGEIEQTNNSNLKQLTTFAIAGATFFEDQRIIIPTDTSTTATDTTTQVTPTTTTNGAGTTTTTSTSKTKTPTKEVVVKAATTYETFPALRYVERATGHIFEIELDKNLVNKISNTTIPSIYEAFFDSKASTVIYRYLSEDNTINSFMATLGGSNGNFLAPDIIDMSSSQDQTKLFYLAKSQNGVVGYIGSYGKTSANQVFSSSFDEWLSQYVSDKQIYLTTKPSWSVNGNLYSLNTSTGTLSKIFGGIAGLTTLANNDGSTVLFGASLSNGPKLELFNLANHSTSQLDTYGLPEKCVWSRDNVSIYCGVPKTIIGTEFPDSWYQGLVSFDDYFVKINTTTGGVSTIENDSNSSPIDATHLFLDKGEQNLYFTNKKDSTLWSLKIN